LLGFAIATLVDRDGTGSGPALLRLEAGGAFTPQFAASDQITRGAITTTTDIYALGLLLYLLLTGRRTTGERQSSPAELMKAIMDTETPRPSQLPATPDSDDLAMRRAATPEKLSRQLRGDLDTIIAKALKKNPLERYGSVTAFAD